MLRIVLALLLALWCSWAHAAEPLVLVSDTWPPFTGPPGTPRCALDLAHEALRRARVAARTEIVPTEEFQIRLMSDDVDGSAAAWKSAEREERLLYSRPYLVNRLVLVRGVGQDVSAAALSELAGLRIGLIGGYAYGDEIAATPGLALVYVKDMQAQVDALRAGTIDGFLVDDLVVQTLLEAQPDAREHLAVGRQGLITRGLYFAVRRDRPGAAAIIEAFDEAIHEMIGDGTYNQVLVLGAVTADADGDGREELVLWGKKVGDLPPTRSYAVDGSTELPSRFWIDGKAYESWDAVPDAFKVPAVDRDPPPTMSQFSVRF